MSWREVGLTDASGGELGALPGEWQTIRHSRPQLFWYPGSGFDLLPIDLHRFSEAAAFGFLTSRGRNEGIRPLLLWMNDHCSGFRDFPAGIAWKDYCYSPARASGLHVQRVGQFRVTARTGGDAVPVPVQLLRIRDERAGTGCETIACYSPVDSRTLLDTLFAPCRLPIHTVALINQGTGGLDGGELVDGFNQYDWPAKLAEAHYTRRVGRVRRCITDRPRHRDMWFQREGWHGVERWEGWGREEGAVAFVPERSIRPGADTGMHA